MQQSWNSLAKWSLDNGKIISVSTVCNCNSVKRCAEFIRSLCECRKGERVVLRCPRPYASRVKHTLCAFLFVWEGDLTFQRMRCSHFLPADWAAVVSLTLLVNLSPSPARRARASVVCVWEEEKDRLCVCSMCAGRPQVSAHGVRVLRGLPRGPMTLIICFRGRGLRGLPTHTPEAWWGSSWQAGACVDSNPTCLNPRLTLHTLLHKCLEAEDTDWSECRGNPLLHTNTHRICFHEVKGERQRKVHTYCWGCVCLWPCQ